MTGAQLRKAVANDPTKPMVQALCDAANGILDPGFLKGGNLASATSTPDTTCKTTRVAIERGTTPENTAIHITDMLGNLNMAPHNEPIFTSKDSIVYTAIMLGNTATTAKGPSQVAADAPGHLDNATASSYNFFDNTDDAAGLSITSNTKFGPPDQATPGVEGGDEVSEITKAKEKRESRKRVEAIAGEVATNAGDSAGDRDGNEEEAPGLTNV